MKHPHEVKRLDQDDAKGLMKQFLIKHYLGEVEGEVIAGSRERAVYWLDLAITISGDQEYDDVEDAFYSWMYNVDTRVQNVVDTLLTLLVHRDSETVVS